jgi:alkylation response protein AidB-like acyl-CoA dehydrogenase
LALEVLTVFSQSPASTHPALFFALAHVAAEAAGCAAKGKADMQAASADDNADSPAADAVAAAAKGDAARVRASASSTLWTVLQTVSVILSKTSLQPGTDGAGKKPGAGAMQALRTIQKFRQQCLLAEAASAEVG